MAAVALMESPVDNKKLAHRNPTEWSSLYNKTFPELYQYAFRRLGSDEDARDLVAQTFEIAIVNADKLAKLEVTPVAWLYGILRNLCKKTILERGSNQISKTNAEWILNNLSYEAEPDDSWSESFNLEKAFSRLKKTEREVIELCVIAGLSVKEVAAIMGISQGAVRVIKAKAIKLLRVHISALQSYEERRSYHSANNKIRVRDL